LPKAKILAQLPQPSKPASHLPPSFHCRVGPARQPALLIVFLPSPVRAPLTPCAYASGWDRLAGLVRASTHAEQRASPPPRVLRPEKYPFYPCTVTPIGLRSPLVHGHVVIITLAPNRNPGRLLPSPTIDRAPRRGPKPHPLLAPKPIGIFPFLLAFRFTATLYAFPTSLLRPSPSHLVAPLCSSAACSSAPHPAASFCSSARTPTLIHLTVSRVTPRVPSPLTTKAAPSTNTDDDTEQEPASGPSRTTTVSKTRSRGRGVPRRREPEGAEQGINTVAVNLTCLPT
jgi:hypothetical protein